MVILVGIAIPSYVLYVQSRGAVFKSRLAILSTLAAQDEIEDLRLLSLTGSIPRGQQKFSLFGVPAEALQKLLSDTGLTASPPPPSNAAYITPFSGLYLEVADETSGRLRAPRRCATGPSSRRRP